MVSETGGFPEYGIIYRIESESIPYGNELEKLKLEISKYLETMVEVNLRILLNKRDKNDLLYNNTADFFRKRERYRQAKKLIQYLLRFLDGLPGDEITGRENTDHFQRFKGLVNFQAELLRDEDVIEAMVTELEELKIVNQMNLWYYKGKMRSAYHKITGLISRVERPVIEDFHKLFEALRRISSFWFSVRREDEKRVRITDLYIYRLIRILIHIFPP